MLKPVIANPIAVPAAGGCSASRTTIKKIDMPTAKEYINAVKKIVGWGIKAHTEPEIIPIVCPPITFLACAVILFGIAKTINAVAPIDAIITACLILKSNNTTKTVTVASRL
jgi:hypothetical protein